MNYYVYCIFDRKILNYVLYSILDACYFNIVSTFRLYGEL